METSLLVDRPLYTRKLADLTDVPVTKVITGMRRCGKSSVLQLFKQQLLAKGIDGRRIIHMNFDSIATEPWQEAKLLYRHIAECIGESRDRYYLLFDEIQEVRDWPRAINSFMTDFSVDLTITGSNAHLLSSELSTFLSGRYVEIPMLPLSFAEYIDFNRHFREEDKSLSEDRLFSDYLQYGSMPVLFYHRRDESLFSSLLLGLYNTVLTKDILARYQVKDVVVLDRLLRFIMANIGQTISGRKISTTLSSENIQVSHITVLHYLQMFCDAFILYRAEREDVVSRDVLRTQEKYYTVDIGIRNMLLGLRSINMGSILENLVYLELLRRGYRVRIGKINQLEVDFIAEKTDRRLYIQVTQTLSDPRTMARELEPLLRIPDQYPRAILSMDRTIAKDENGILLLNIVDELAFPEKGWL